MKYEEKTFKVVDYHDLDKFINDNVRFSDPFECITSDAWDNYSYHRINVTGELGEYELARMGDILDTGEWEGNNETSIILNYLCREGKLEAGEYLIEVFW